MKRFSIMILTFVLLTTVIMGCSTNKISKGSKSSKNTNTQEKLKYDSAKDMSKDSDLLSIISEDDSNPSLEDIDMDKEIEAIDKILENEDLFKDIPSEVNMP